MPACVRHICLSTTRGVAKHEVDSVQLIADFGIEGDAHAGDWHRQLSLLAITDIDSMRAKGLELAPGAFGENLVIEGLDLGRLGVGSRLQLAAALIEITQIGKKCHSRCAIYDQTGDCIMPRQGLFARILTGGRLDKGAEVNVVHRADRRAPATNQKGIAQLASEVLHD